MAPTIVCAPDSFKHALTARDAAAAMASAAELENRFCQAHAQSLSQGALPELRAFFEQLAAQDKAHAALHKG